MSTRPRPPLWFFALAACVGLLFTPGAAGATAAGRPVAWGCIGPIDAGQCSVPSGLANVTAVAAGVHDSLALKADGTVVAWGCGFNEAGQCSVPIGLSGVTAIAASWLHSLALKGDGSVVAWGCGSGNAGQCNVPPGLAGVTAIAAGNFHSLALKNDGTVVAWGCISFNYGQCNVTSGLSGVTAIAASTYHSLALKSDGTVVAWGCSPADAGQCNVPMGLSGVTAIAASEYHSLALKSDGTVVAWGCGGAKDVGQCSVPPGLSGVTAITAGDAHSLALKSDGTVVAWGCGGTENRGQCAVPGGLAKVAAIAGAYGHSLALIELSNQTITFGPLGNKTYRDPDFTISATASSGLPVAFATTGNCLLSGALVRITGVGSCTVTASQPGDANYNPAPDVSQTFAIAKSGQTILFGPLASKTYGAPPFGLIATASSGLTVSFTASGSCAVSGFSGATLHLRGVGSCTVTASQPGDANYHAAPDVSRTFSIIARAPSGVAPCRVPKVVGKRVAAAKLMIARRRCRTGKVAYAYSRKRRRGIVISQSRRPGAILSARSKINLVVSRGSKR